MLRKVNYNDLNCGDKFYMYSDSEVTWVKTKVGYTIANHLDMIGSISIDGRLAYRQSETIGYMQNREVFVESKPISVLDVPLGSKFIVAHVTYLRVYIMLSANKYGGHPSQTLITGIVIDGERAYKDYLYGECEVYLVD